MFLYIAFTIIFGFIIIFDCEHMSLTNHDNCEKCDYIFGWIKEVLKIGLAIMIVHIVYLVIPVPKEKLFTIYINSTPILMKVQANE